MSFLVNYHEATFTARDREAMVEALSSAVGDLERGNNLFHEVLCDYFMARDPDAIPAIEVNRISDKLLIVYDIITDFIRYFYLVTASRWEPEVDIFSQTVKRLSDGLECDKLRDELWSKVRGEADSPIRAKLDETEGMEDEAAIKELKSLMKGGEADGRSTRKGAGDAPGE